MTAAQTKKKRSKRVSTGFAPVFCNVIGTLLIVGVFALTLPLAVPQMLGYQVFDVVSGSMEPEIPVGSVIYVRPVDPADVQEDEVIAFNDGDSVVAHRVVTNRTSLGEFVTKGDANNVEDLHPTPYDAVVGKVAMSIPFVGHAMSLYASNVGKVYLFLTLACGVMLNILADRMRRQRSREIRRKMREERRAVAAAGEAGATGAVTTGATGSVAAGDTGTGARSAKRGKRSSRKGRGWVRITIMAVLALVFTGSLGVVMYVNNQYEESYSTYHEAQQAYTVKGTVAPIQVDFASLQAVNPDVIGWLYCENTAIDYPVLHGTDNDQYLRHDYTGDYNINGSIFIESENRPDFSDANTIIYGHHMSTGTMFATLEDWADQSFYEDHPVMWLLTPTQDYQVVLVSGHHVSAYSDLYQILHEHNADFEHFLMEATSSSDFTPVAGADVNMDRNYVMLSTCAYVFDNARYVLHGKLVPVNSAGGVEK